MLAALAWVPRGAATTKLPKGVVNDNDDDMDTSMNDQGKTEADQEGSHQGQDGSDGEEVDIDEILANDLDTLAFHKPGEKDPYLSSGQQQNQIFDEEELEDLNMRPTDSLIVSIKTGEDASYLEVHVFDDDPDGSDGEEGEYVPHTYVHHDIVLPFLPLCTAYTQLKAEQESLNLVAVGMFTPGIDIWDVDRVNNLEPVISLGGYDHNDSMQTALSAAQSARRGGKVRRKSKPKLRLKDDSHSDAVMSLSWNEVQREYIASGSADSTVKVWDVESSHCACTLNHHSDKVQSVAFHPSEPQILVSGSFDRSVRIADVRGGNGRALMWSVDADIETVQWGFGATAGMVIATTEEGHAYVFDARQTGDGGVVAKWKAHQGAATACSVSRDVSGLMVTAGVDKMVKVWDLEATVSRNTGDLVYETQSKVGSLFTLSLCDLPREKETNASPFVVAFGGAKGILSVTDLAIESMAVRKRFGDKCNPAASKVIEKRAVRGISQSKSNAITKGRSMILNDNGNGDAEKNVDIDNDSESDEDDD